MNVIAKSLIPNKEWLIKIDEQKVGSISKKKREVLFLKNGKIIKFNSISEIKKTLNVEFEESTIKHINNKTTDFSVYGYPCNCEPFDPVYNLKKRLPLYTKNAKSKCRVCAGYYLVRSKNQWQKKFCPKLIVLERNPYYGPFKTEFEACAYMTHLHENETA
jgi:hypothetical protein